MKVSYNDKLIFRLPSDFDTTQRLIYISEILDSYSDYFTYTENQDTPYDMNIHRVLNQFSYYLCTADKIDSDGKAIRNDTDIMRVRKIKKRKQSEMPLKNYIAYGSTDYDDKGSVSY